MFIKFSLKLLILIVFCSFSFLLFSGEAAGTAGKPGGEEDSDRWYVFPSARLYLDPMYIFNRDSDLTGVFTSGCEFDIIRFSDCIMSFSMIQMLEYYEKNSEKFAFHEIQYNLDYLNLRKKFNTGSLSMFLDHRCTNYINVHSSDEMITRWYGYGIRWESAGMVTGEKNRRRGTELFSQDSFINYRFAARKSIATLSYPATWSFDITIRYDYYLTDYFALYIQGGAEYFVSDLFGLNRSAESGFKLSQGDVEFTPYFRYEYITDNTGEIPGAKKHYGAGIRAESSLYAAGEDSCSTAGRSPWKEISSDFHLNALYGRYIDDDKKNYRAETLLALDVIKYRDTSLFFNASLVHSSSKENAGMYPAYIDSYYESGLSFHLFRNLMFDPLYRHTDYDEGNIIKSGPWSSHMAGLRIRSTGLKPGFINSGGEPEMKPGFNFINNFEFEITGGYILREKNTETAWTAESAVRWDILGYNSSILYLQLGEKSSKEDDLSWTVITETGVRFRKYPVFMLFYRNEFNDSENRISDISRVYHLIGIKSDI